MLEVADFTSEDIFGVSGGVENGDIAGWNDDCSGGFVVGK